jgi:hypothetical protein
MWSQAHVQVKRVNGVDVLNLAHLRQVVDATPAQEYVSAATWALLVIHQSL